jgi:hypothetical protein
MDGDEDGFSPLAHVVLLVLPPAAAEELVSWIQKEGFSQPQLQPVLLDMAMVVQAAAAPPPVSGSASAQSEVVADAIAASEVGVATGSGYVEDTPPPLPSGAAAYGAEDASATAAAADAVILMNLGGAAAASLIPFMRANSLWECVAFLELNLQLILGVTAAEMAAVIAVAVAVSANTQEAAAAGSGDEAATPLKDIQAGAVAARPGAEAGGMAEAASAGESGDSGETAAVLGTTAGWRSALKLSWWGFGSAAVESEYLHSKAEAYRKVDLLVEVYRMALMMWFVCKEMQLVEGTRLFGLQVPSMVGKLAAIERSDKEDKQTAVTVV